MIMAQKKKSQKNNWPVIIILVILMMGAGTAVYQKVQYHRTIQAFTTIVPQQVSTFRIYPRVFKPVGTPIEFRNPDPMIDEFFHFLTDLRSYQPSHDTVTSRDHSWFLEVATEDSMIQISFHIPSHLDDTVAGLFGKYSNTRYGTYGSFQSQELFQWYQKYSHRWLNPSESSDP